MTVARAGGARRGGAPSPSRSTTLPRARPAPRPCALEGARRRASTWLRTGAPFLARARRARGRRASRRRRNRYCIAVDLPHEEVATRTDVELCSVHGFVGVRARCVAVADERQSARRGGASASASRSLTGVPADEALALQRREPRARRAPAPRALAVGFGSVARLARAVTEAMRRGSRRRGRTDLARRHDAATSCRGVGSVGARATFSETRRPSRASRTVGDAEEVLSRRRRATGRATQRSRTPPAAPIGARAPAATCPSRARAPERDRADAWRRPGNELPRRANRRDASAEVGARNSAAAQMGAPDCDGSRRVRRARLVPPPPAGRGRARGPSALRRRLRGSAWSEQCGGIAAAAIRADLARLPARAQRPRQARPQVLAVRTAAVRQPSGSAAFCASRAAPRRALAHVVVALDARRRRRAVPPRWPHAVSSANAPASLVGARRRRRRRSPPPSRRGRSVSQRRRGRGRARRRRRQRQRRRRRRHRGQRRPPPRCPLGEHGVPSAQPRLQEDRRCARQQIALLQRAASPTGRRRVRRTASERPSASAPVRQRQVGADRRRRGGGRRRAHEPPLGDARARLARRHTRPTVSPNLPAEFHDDAARRESPLVEDGVGGRRLRRAATLAAAAARAEGGGVGALRLAVRAAFSMSSMKAEHSIPLGEHGGGERDLGLLRERDGVDKVLVCDGAFGSPGTVALRAPPLSWSMNLLHAPALSSTSPGSSTPFCSARICASSWRRSDERADCKASVDELGAREPVVHRVGARGSASAALSARLCTSYCEPPTTAAAGPAERSSRAVHRCAAPTSITPARSAGRAAA